MSESEDSIAPTTAQISAAHKQETSASQQMVDRFTAFAGRPGFVMALAGAVFAWAAANAVAVHLGYKAPDPPPFSLLQGGITVGTLLVAALILTTQRHEDELTSHRAQLILELIISNDQKCSKIIKLLEESRRDNPAIANRIDHQAAAMSEPSDTLAVLKAIKTGPGWPE